MMQPAPTRSLAADQRAISRFVIVFPERSGSTHLVELLNSHPDIICRHEDFHEVVSQPQSGHAQPGRRSDFETPDSSLRWLTEFYYPLMFPENVQAIGFKYKYYMQFELYPEVWDFIREKRLKVVHIYRENLLKAAVSRQNLERLQRAGKDGNLVTFDPFTLEKLHLNVANAIEYMRHAQDVHNRYVPPIRQMPDVFEVTYEALLRDRDSVVGALLTFLNVEQSIGLASWIRKTTCDSLQDAVANYDELVASLRGTEFVRYLV